MPEVPATNFQLSKECRDLMRAIGVKLGISDVAAMELAIRRMAETEGVQARSRKQKGE